MPPGCLLVLINGCQGTLALIAELLQPESPLMADVLIALAQVSLGAHVDSREGPPGTGKSHVKGLLTLVIEIRKLTRVDQPKLGKDLTIMQSAQNAAVIEFISTIYKVVGPEAPMTGSTGRLPLISQQTKTISSPLDANPALIANCDTVCVTQGTLERECGKIRSPIQISDTIRNVIDEKQMSEGAAPNENSPMIDEIVRKNRGIEELIGDRKQSRGGREILVQRIATIHAIFMKVAGTGTHTGYVTCPTSLTQCELLLLSRIMPPEIMIEQLDESTRTIQKLAKAVDHFKEELDEYK